MNDKNQSIFDMQGEAALDAYQAFKMGVECLPHINELADEISFNQAILLNSFIVNYLFSLKVQEILEHLADISEGIDCYGVTSSDFWLTSQLAAIDKAKEIGLTIDPEWTQADLRYKLHKAIYGGDNG